MFDKKKIEEGIRLLLEGIGENPDREGLKDTPDRVARMYEELCSGMNRSPKEHLSKTFTCDNENVVIEKDITFYSTCEHHLMPFYGKVHIAYIPNGKVVGISKLARTVEVYARRLQIQEQMTNQIAKALEKYLVRSSDNAAMDFFSLRIVRQATAIVPTEARRSISHGFLQMRFCIKASPKKR